MLRSLSDASAGIDLNAMAVLTVSPKLCLPQASSPTATTQFNKMVSDIKHLIQLCLYVYKLLFASHAIENNKLECL